jgi:hypothetical protein
MKLARKIVQLAASLLALGAGALVTVPAAQAQIIYDFTVDHCTGGCGTPPFGEVTLTQVGGNVTIDVHLLSGNQYVKTGAADFMDFKFNATGVVLADITIDAHTPGLIAQTGIFSGDGTGLFGFGITCPTCGNGGSGRFSDDIVFHVSNATIADLISANSLGFVFVADILSGQTGRTGPVAAVAPVSVIPEPETYAMLLAGLGLLGFAARRRKLKLAA